MKKKLLLFPLIIVILIILAGVGMAGAAIYFGGGTGGETNSQSINLQKGLVGNWKMDGNANDFSAYRNNGTVTGATLTTDRKGQANKAYSFNGTSNRIKVGNITAYDLDTFTISAWVKKTALTATGTLFALQVQNNDYSGGASGHGFRVTSTGAVQIYGFGNNGTSGNYRSLLTDTGIISAGVWYRLTATVTAGTATIYIDGVQKAQDTSWHTTFVHTGTGRGTFVGVESQSSSQNGTLAVYWDGQIDDVRIYNRALTSAEISSLYESYNPGIQVSDLQKGLVGNWKMDGNANDFSAYRNNGTVTGATLTTDRKGQASKAYSFNGTTDSIAVADAANLSFTSGGMSVSAWVYADDTTSRTIVSKYDNTTAAGLREYLFYFDSGGALRFIVYDESVDAAIGREYSGVVSTGVWHHVIATYNGGTLSTGVKIYLDGVQVDDTTNEAGTFVAMEDLATSVSVGSFPQGSGSQGQFFDGKIDDVRIYNRALSATEITALYESYNPSVQISDLQKGLVGNWKMDGNANDFSAYRNHGTVTGATLNTDRKGQINKAYNFNGTITDYISIPYSSTLAPTQITVAAWFKTSDKTADGRVVSKTQQGGYNISLNENVTCTSNTLCFVLEINDSYTGNYVTYPTSSLNNDQWYHVVGTYDGSTITMYLDGVSVGTPVNRSGSITYSNNNTLCIGREPGANTCSDLGYFPGFIDDVRIYNRALTTTEVADLYNSY